MFAVVAGSGSGKLCWHSRGNDNDQENAGYVRESAGGSEQALRLRAGVQRKFTVFLQNLKVELRKASML